jgi:hypothetical protein
MAGNVALLKHAGHVPGCVLAIEDLFVRAGCPARVMTALLVIPSDWVAGLIRHPAVRAVSLTGSDRAGEAVGQKRDPMAELVHTFGNTVKRRPSRGRSPQADGRAERRSGFRALRLNRRIHNVTGVGVKVVYGFGRGAETTTRPSRVCCASASSAANSS